MGRGSIRLAWLQLTYLRSSKEQKSMGRGEADRHVTSRKQLPHLKEAASDMSRVGVEGSFHFMSFSTFSVLGEVLGL